MRKWMYGSLALALAAAIAVGIWDYKTRKDEEVRQNTWVLTLHPAAGGADSLALNLLDPDAALVAAISTAMHLAGGAGPNPEADAKVLTLKYTHLDPAVADMLAGTATERSPGHKDKAGGAGGPGYSITISGPDYYVMQKPTGQYYLASGDPPGKVHEGLFDTAADCRQRVSQYLVQEIRQQQKDWEETTSRLGQGRDEGPDPVPPK